MPVDMFEWRFREELNKLPPFTPNDERDECVWRAEFPAWRALFSALCLWRHSTGYHLPSFDDFVSLCEKAYAEKHHGSRFARYFKGDLRDGMLQRISAWYESGMAETYLYVCLVEAIEDKSKAGVVLYDPRADWKLKADVVVIVNRQPMRVSAFIGDQTSRPAVEARRDTVERWRKRNTKESSHWGNTELERMPVLEIARTEGDQQIVNGVRLFSLSSINRLLGEIYQIAGKGGWLYS